MSDTENATTHDIVIVGAGTAGSVLANRLSEDTNLSVLVIEAGIERNDDLGIQAPGASASLIGNPSYDWCFQTTEQVGRRF
jgi:choline dehydrogenase